MAISSELSIKGESIQQLYGSYLNKNYIVNRRYQRKLVWTIEEKKAFIDSILNYYPVPLILLADVKTGDKRYYEIIDGMQRLNAIMSFIDQEFPIDGKYFDLDTMADTKLLKDSGVLVQKNPVLERELCAKVVGYTVPISIFQESKTSHIDEVFRRLNSGGRHLSKQELRQAGAVSKFATIIRKLSADIRGDSSQSDKLDLNSMKQISITNKQLEYGIAIDDIFWIKNNIIRKEALRESKDEEIIADIVAWIILDKKLRSSSEILNQLYDFSPNNKDSDSSLSEQLEIGIQKVNEESIRSNVQYVLDTIIKLLKKKGKSLSSLLFTRPQPNIPRYFQIVFLAFYHLLIDENLTIAKEKDLLKLLDGAGSKTIRLAAGGGNWSAKEKQNQINAFCGVIRDCFEKAKENDPARNQWVSRFENILMQSSTEQALYDFKVGLHPIGAQTDKKKIDTPLSKIVKTLTAMANTFPDEGTGYCILGVADKESTAKHYKKIYKSSYQVYSNFYVTGVESEANKHFRNVDDFFTLLIQKIKEEPITEEYKDYICRNVVTVKYFDHTIILLQIKALSEAAIYDDKFYVRHGSNVSEVKPREYSTFFARFGRK